MLPHECVGTGVMMKEVPAPGEYDRIQTEVAKTNEHKVRLPSSLGVLTHSLSLRCQGFLSTQNRFVKGKGALPAPGPGSYRHQEGMIKRSFNVTIDI